MNAEGLLPVEVPTPRPIYVEKFIGFPASILPVLSILNSVVVALAVDDAIAKSMPLGDVSPVFAWIERRAHGVVVPMPTLPLDVMRIRSVPFVENPSEFDAGRYIPVFEFVTPSNANDGAEALPAICRMGE